MRTYRMYPNLNDDLLLILSFLLLIIIIIIIITITLYFKLEQKYFTEKLLTFLTFEQIAVCQ
jgi:hypothetical protein